MRKGLGEMQKMEYIDRVNRLVIGVLKGKITPEEALKEFDIIKLKKSLGGKK